MYNWDRVDEAVRYIRKACAVVPRAAVVLGSGLGSVADHIENAKAIPYGEIPYWPRSTAPGHAGRLILGTLRGVPVAAMQGRVHYYEGYSMAEVTFPVRVFGTLGVKVLVVTNASGALDASIAPGSIVAIEDHINLMGTNPLIGVNNDDWGPRFPDMTEAYDRELLAAMERVAAKEGIALRRGVYAAFSGPSFETPAEVRMARMLGGDVVGMSTVPEVIAANHMGIRVAGLSCAANPAAGLGAGKLTHTEVLAVMEKSGGEVARLIEAFIQEVRP